jgi:hypothetical protein
MMVAKFIISSSSVGATDVRSRHPHRRPRRKSRSRSAREYVSRLPGAWLMDVQDSFSDTAR